MPCLYTLVNEQNWNHGVYSPFLLLPTVYYFKGSSARFEEKNPVSSFQWDPSVAFFPVQISILVDPNFLLALFLCFLFVCFVVVALIFWWGPCFRGPCQQLLTLLTLKSASEGEGGASCYLPTSLCTAVMQTSLTVLQLKYPLWNRIGRKRAKGLY